MNPLVASRSLRAAVDVLFDDPSVALVALGLDSDADSDLREPPLSTTASPIDRARALRRQLETYLGQMAVEHRELESPETSESLRMQAIGLLVAIRELNRHFPESQGN